MQISAQQAATLSQPQIQSFETRAQAFLKHRFPAIARRDDPAPLARFVAHGHQRAVLHGFTGERAIVDYLVVMMQLGPFFDVDPVREPVLRLFLDPASSMKPAMRMRVLLAAGNAAARAETGAPRGA
jgi:hypothetical protein